jgi:hypothetical protein
MLYGIQAMQVEPDRLRYDGVQIRNPYRDFGTAVRLCLKQPSKPLNSTVSFGTGSRYGRYSYLSLPVVPYCPFF